jgi:hypothetical protein
VFVLKLADFRQLTSKFRLLSGKSAFSKLFRWRFVNAGDSFAAVFMQPIHALAQLELATKKVFAGFRPRVHAFLIIAFAGEKTSRLSGLVLVVFVNPIVVPIQRGLGFLLLASLA